MSRHISSQDGFSLIEVGYTAMTQSYEYRVHSPQWTAGFILPEQLSDEVYISASTDRAVDRIVDDILKNPKVKKELDRRLRYQRYLGYIGAYREYTHGEKFDLESLDE